MLNRKVCLQFAASLIRLHELFPRRDESSRRPDLGMLARLRHGLGKEFGEDSQRDGWVLATLDVCGEDEERALSWNTDSDIGWACLVASLFATHRNANQDRFGVAFRRLWKKQDECVTISRRFTMLLESDARDLPKHLRRALALLKSHELGLDWAALLFDLTRWEDPDRRVHRRWSRHFWTESGTKSATAQLPPTTQTISE